MVRVRNKNQNPSRINERRAAYKLMNQKLTLLPLLIVSTGTINCRKYNQVRNKSGANNDLPFHKK